MTPKNQTPQKSQNHKPEEKLKVQEGIGCPHCKSKNIKQVRNSEYPIMECKDCGKRYFSD